MPVYKIVEVGSGGSGGGCLFTAFLLAIGLFTLADACDSSGPRSPEGVSGDEVPSAEEAPASSSSGQTRSEMEPEPSSLRSCTVGLQASRRDRKHGVSEPPREDLPERPFRSRYINDWLLRSLRSEDEPVVVVEQFAMPGEPPFERRLVEALRGQDIPAQAGVLKQVAFKNNRIFRRLARGDGEMLQRLGLAQLSGYLVLFRFRINRVRTTQDSLTTKVTLSARFVPISGGQPAVRGFEETGPGFLGIATERVLRRVCSDFLSSSLIKRLTRQ
jgi:hypothetical protein